MISIILVILLNLSFIFFLKFIKHKYKTLSQFYLRKILHMVSAVVAAYCAFNFEKFEYLIIIGFFALLYPALYFKKLFKEIEVKEYINFGSFLYPLGLLAMGLTLFDDRLAHIIGIILLGFPDALASIVDYFYGNKKSRWGRTVYFISAFMILITAYDLLTAMFIGFILTIAEFFSRKGWDNFYIPLLYLLLIFYL